MNSSQKRLFEAGLITALFAFGLLSLFAWAMIAKLNHDENQFIASGQLFASLGELPYRDYPYFHMPLLVWIYGGIFHFTNHLLLAARTFSVVCAWLSLVIIFMLSRKLLDQPNWWCNMFMAVGITALLFVNQIFISTYFRAWNQALPVLLTLFAFLCHWSAATRQAGFLFFLSGIILALAAGTRLTFTPLELPFLIMVWWVPTATNQRRVKYVVLHCLGFAIGLFLVLIPVLRDYNAFLFDNFIINGPIRNTQLDGTNGQFQATIAGKAWFFFIIMTHPAANLFFALAFVVLGLYTPYHRKEYLYPRRFILLLIAFSFIGALAPTPSHQQYYYPLITFGVMAIAFGLSEYQTDQHRFKCGLAILWGAVLIAAIPASHQYRQIFAIAKVEQWKTHQLHQEGVALRAYVNMGRVLTMAPIIPLEGGLRIYEPFATGPFAWRCAHLLSPEQRERYMFVAEVDLPRLLDRTPPDAILVGYDKKYEVPLVDYAHSHGYRQIALSKKHVLYLRPIAESQPASTP